MMITIEGAARVLGVLRWRAEQILGPGPYEFDTVEEAARTYYRLEDHREDDTSYWVDTVQAAAILEVSANRVRQLCGRGRIPFLVHAGERRRWMMRRAQIEVVAHARTLRRNGPGYPRE